MFFPRRIGLFVSALAMVTCAGFRWPSEPRNHSSSSLVEVFPLDAWESVVQHDLKM